MKNLLKVLFTVVFAVMVCQIIKTSNESSLFKLMEAWGDCSLENPYPWFSATLWDFYANVIAIYAWVFYKETAWWSKIFWLLMLVVWGSPATALYILIQLFKLKQNEGVAELLVKRN